MPLFDDLHSGSLVLNLSRGSLRVQARPTLAWNLKLTVGGDKNDRDSFLLTRGHVALRRTMKEFEQTFCDRLLDTTDPGKTSIIAFAIAEIESVRKRPLPLKLFKALWNEIDLNFEKHWAKTGGYSCGIDSKYFPDDKKIVLSSEGSAHKFVLDPTLSDSDLLGQLLCGMSGRE